jgi:hypothetical protein
VLSAFKAIEEQLDRVAKRGGGEPANSDELE